MDIITKSKSGKKLTKTGQMLLFYCL